MSLDLSEMMRSPLPATLKGLATTAVGRPLGSIGNLGLRLLEGDLPFPVAILKESALVHNLQWMKEFAERAGVDVCPHGKTTMSPQLFERQLLAGSWGITAATASHVRSYRHFGVPRVILANQLIGRSNIDLVLDELEADPTFDFYSLVDSLDGLEELREALARRPQGRPLQLLLEVGASGGRTGVRTLEEGIRLGRAVKASGSAIALRGIETFEGIVGGDERGAELFVYSMLDTISTLARTGVCEDWFAPGEILLSAGGSAFFDLAAGVLRSVPDANVRVVLRSGCYLTHDALHYARMQSRMQARSPTLWGAAPGLKNALEVWSVVQSVPEQTRAIVALGKRDVSHDLGLPQPLWWYRLGAHGAPQAVPPSLRVTALNDQHAYVDCVEADMLWRVGDLVGLGVGHPCTTFDKWPLLYTVDDDYRVTGGVRTFF